MHSFHPSRGRVLFNFVCALGMVASCVGAWKQTDAPALLAAAAVVALFGFVQLFDLARPKPTELVEPQRIDFEPGGAVLPLTAVETQPTTANRVEEADIVELVTPRPNIGRAKAPRKGGGRRAKAPKVAKVAKLAPAEEEDVPWPTAPEEANLAEMAPPAEEEYAPEESDHPHIAQLFEPEPYARMPRRAFGRRGRN